MPRIKNIGSRPSSTPVCCWHDRIRPPHDLYADDWQPTVQEPLVYHLDSLPESLVLSEDDYLSFLVNLAGGRHQAYCRMSCQEKGSKQEILFGCCYGI